MRNTLFAALIIGAIFSAIIMAGVWSQENPITKGEIICGILCAAVCIICYHGVENEDYSDEDG